jgi:predicted PurR-regulated permease PerM
VATPPTPRLPAGERLRRAGIGAWSIIGILILGAVAVWALLKIRIIFPPLVLALLIIYVLNPLIGWLERKGVARTAGALGTYVIVLGGISLLVIALIPKVSEQVTTFGDQWPRFSEKVVRFVDDTAGSIEDRFGTQIDTTQVDCLLGSEQAPSAAECDSVTRQLRQQITSQAGRLTQLGSSLLEALLVFILAPLIALYLLIDLPNLGRDLTNLVPESYRDEITDLGTKVSRAVGGFFRGQLLVALIVGVLSSVGFRLIGLPFWLVIGAIAGFFNLVPLVGPYIGGGLGFLVGTIGGSITLGLKAALVELIVQQLDNHVISPNVMKRTVNLHPVTVMLSLLAGGTLAGFWGVLLGVPAVAVAKLLLGHVWATRVLGVDVAPQAAPNGGGGESTRLPADEHGASDAGEEGLERAEDGAGPTEGSAEDGAGPTEGSATEEDLPDTPEERAEPYPVPDRRA